MCPDIYGYSLKKVSSLRHTILQHRLSHNYGHRFVFGSIKDSIVIELHPHDSLNYCTYFNRMVQLDHKNRDFYDKIINVHYHFNGHVNNQNGGFWELKNIQNIQYTF